MKVWFNGNKDIFFLKYFGYDIRPLFERYIIWYYDNIEVYIRKLVNEPFLRMIMVPLIIRNSVINSSFFSILKARMFMFFFISILVMSVLNEYLHQPWYIWMIIIYIYFLVIWPRVITNLDISNFFKEKSFHSSYRYTYTTTLTIYSIFLLVHNKSISLKLFDHFIFFFKAEVVKNKNLYLFCFFPPWYGWFLAIDSLNIYNEIDYVENDRKLPAIIFWRYEKTYTSFICFFILLSSSFRINLTYYYALNEGFYGRHISEEEAEKMKEYLELYISLFLKLFVFSIRFLNYTREDWIYYLAGRAHLSQIFEKKGIEINYIEDVNAYVHLYTLIRYFYYMSQLIIPKQNIVVEFSSIINYYSIIKCTSFFYFLKSDLYIDKLVDWMIVFIKYFDNEEIEKKVKKENTNINFINKINDVFHYKLNENILFSYEIDWFDSIIEKSNLMGNKEFLEIINKEINELINLDNEKKMK